MKAIGAAPGGQHARADRGALAPVRPVADHLVGAGGLGRRRRCRRRTRRRPPRSRGRRRRRRCRGRRGAGRRCAPMRSCLAEGGHHDGEAAPCPGASAAVAGGGRGRCGPPRRARPRTSGPTPRRRPGRRDAARRTRAAESRSRRRSGRLALIGCRRRRRTGLGGVGPDPASMAGRRGRRPVGPGSAARRGSSAVGIDTAPAGRRHAAAAATGRRRRRVPESARRAPLRHRRGRRDRRRRARRRRRAPVRRARRCREPRSGLGQVERAAADQAARRPTTPSSGDEPARGSRRWCSRSAADTWVAVGHHDHEVGRHPVGPVGPVDLPVREVRRLHQHRLPDVARRRTRCESLPDVDVGDLDRVVGGPRSGTVVDGGSRCQLGRGRRRPGSTSHWLGVEVPGRPTGARSQSSAASDVGEHRRLVVERRRPARCRRPRRPPTGPRWRPR